MGNSFSEEQLQFLYEDQEFITFMSDYFTSFETTSLEIDMDVDEKGVDNINIYARILLANVGQFYELIGQLRDHASFSHTKVNQYCVGEIRGALLINHYSKEIASHHFPRRYDCVQKRKTYVTPENVLIYYALLRVREIMEQFLFSINDTRSFIKKRFKGSPEYNKIVECVGLFEDYISSRYFSKCHNEAIKYMNAYGADLPSEIIEIVDERIADERIVNTKLYSEITCWIKHFLKRGIVFVSKNNIDILRYDDSFANVLFELWTLFRLKKTLFSKLPHSDEMYYKFNRSDGVVYSCVYEKCNIEFIYQKGKGVYWDKSSPVLWHYVSSAKQLVGKPDITIRVNGSINRIIMFDAKNRIREKGKVSEEVYKMIGYFDNFKPLLEGGQYKDTPKECILIFRNDTNQFREKLERKELDYCIRAVSVSPTNNHELNEAQFEYIADAVLKIIDPEIS